MAPSRGARSASGRQLGVAVAGRGHRGRKRDRTEEGQRPGGHAVAAARPVADGEAHRAGGRTRVRRVHQGHDGGTVRGLDAESVAGLGRVRHGRPEGTNVPDRIVLVSTHFYFIYKIIELF